MALAMSDCEELDAQRCGVHVAARDDADAPESIGDKATRRVAPQPVQAASSTLTDAQAKQGASLCGLFLA